ncbi:hypothetical protein DWQ65_04175 [Treponema phagedenis]|uniref:Uncharacterized protein n=1 Tax=Treponema phagedenis TaxID=162 RepID=A0A0B7GSU9_TREPH|nr:hypothetical protein [Treponema phagedenis]EFW39439.1 hypothetical protein HMPREF9554_00051 [Treponema phagedenis F0421]NVP23085.1 hypothetical protein [Treponema phagedenis]QEJ95031.1 hypothetical protein FUT79_07345 [Treponema phagedenis]QEJ98114.1 hypothetical protein FUT82_08955 [Treponema phagedenis]QEK00955.1 hypothetical protein FUT84_07185 [Treponema phagedenis]
MFEMNPSIIKQEHKGNAYYILTWSPLVKADKYKISTAVPSIAGLYELYRMDESKKLNLLSVTHAWYGGLRSNIRAAIDPDVGTDPERKKLLEDAQLYYRYAYSDSFDDLLDVVWFLHTGYFPDDIRVEPSGRYKKIFLQEKAPDKIFWLE